MFGIVAFVLIGAASDPELVELRYETSRTAWSLCIDYQMERIEGAMVRAELPRAVHVGHAMEQCHVFAQDFRRVLPDSVVIYLREQGVRHYAPSLVDYLADGMFDVVKEDMIREKEAL